MKDIKKQLISIWENEIREGLEQGDINLTSQLQAEFYHQLRLKMPKLKIWVEPIMYLKKYDLDKVKPSLVLTKGTEIVAIIEMKFKPWSFVDYKEELRKLAAFGTVGKAKKIRLAVKPISSNWKEQQAVEDKQFNFTMANDFLKVFISGSKQGCNSINLKKDVGNTTNFLHLYGYVEGEDKTWFGNKSYNMIESAASAKK